MAAVFILAALGYVSLMKNSTNLYLETKNQHSKEKTKDIVQRVLDETHPMEPLKYDIRFTQIDPTQEGFKDYYMGMDMRKQMSKNEISEYEIQELIKGAALNDVKSAEKLQQWNLSDFIPPYN